MALPLYRIDNPPTRLGSGGHPGLWFYRFYDGYDAKWQVGAKSKEVGAKSKENWIRTICGKCGDNEQLIDYRQRQEQLGQALCAQSRVFTTASRLATGLGIDTPVENGFAFHPVLGVPYLSGRGIKGLLRAWCEQWASFTDDAMRAERLTRWLGDSSEEGDGGAGTLIFFDALPIGPLTLECDVMTPHMGKWYEFGHQINGPSDYAEKAPADWHNPEPIPFMTVAPGGQFLVQIAPRDGSDTECAKEVMELLAQALQWIGFGAKTAAGYGRMEEDPSVKSARDEQKRAEEEERRKEELAVERQEQLKQMSPCERAIAEFLDSRADKNQPALNALIRALKVGLWSENPELRTEIAKEVRARMKAMGKWREKSEKKNPTKDDVHQDTLVILALLQREMEK